MAIFFAATRPRSRSTTPKVTTTTGNLKCPLWSKIQISVSESDSTSCFDCSAISELQDEYNKTNIAQEIGVRLVLKNKSLLRSEEESAFHLVAESIQDFNEVSFCVTFLKEYTIAGFVSKVLASISTDVFPLITDL